MELSQIAAAMPQIQWNAFRNVEITEIVNDSRRASPGCLFVAIPGSKSNGEKFIKDAISKGASAVVAESISLDLSIPYSIVNSASTTLASLCSAFWGYPSHKLKIIGITGTNGKTTTSFLLRNILKKNGFRTGLLGTAGYWYMDEYHPSSHTTPDAVSLHRHLAQMVRKNITHVVMEVSSHSLVQNRVAHIDFCAGIFSNLTRDHLDYHKSFSEYLKAKCILFKNLSAKAFAIINQDDPNWQQIQQSTSARCSFYGMQKKADFRAEKVSKEGISSRFILKTKTFQKDIHIHLPGLYNVYNALAASSCASHLGVPIEIIEKALEEKQGVPGRMESMDVGQNFQVLIDYAHTPDALQCALTTLSQTNPKRLFLVFGCGGERDKGKRKLMGEIADQWAYFTWITSDNPRSESPEIIAEEIAKGYRSKNYEICLDREEAIERAINRCQERDILLIAGKGHENIQIIGNQNIPFDDRKMAEKYLKKTNPLIQKIKIKLWNNHKESKMISERIKKFAKVLVDYCLEIKKDEKFLISGKDLASPLILEIYKQALQKGAYPALDIAVPGIEEVYYKFATEEQLQQACDYARFKASYFDAYLTILGGYNTKSMSGIDSNKIAMHARATYEIHQIQMKRMQEQKLRWCATQYPTHSAAQEAGMSLCDYTEFVYQACFLNDENPIESWKNMSKWQARVCEYLQGKKNFRIVSEDTDLTLCTEGRTWINCDGHMNFPDGEVFTGPKEDSINGHIKFSFPGIYSGKAIEDIRLKFENGKVVQASAKVGQELLEAMLNTDEGARFVGEFAIGSNFGIDRFTHNMLYDEKIGGTIHLALGYSLPGSGGKNLSSIHWDMLCDMKHGEIYADDELIYKNTKFIKNFKD